MIYFYDRDVFRGSPRQWMCRLGCMVTAPGHGDVPPIHQGTCFAKKHEEFRMNNGKNDEKMMEKWWKHVGKMRA